MLVRITTDGHLKARPKIYNNIIVWEDFVNSNTGKINLYMYDLEKETKELLSDSGTYDARVDEKDDLRNLTNRGIDLSDNIKSKTLLSDGGSYASIFGDKIVWRDWTSGGSDIYLYDLSSKTKKVIKNGYADSPVIFEDKLVYRDCVLENTGWDYYICLYDLNTGEHTILTKDPSAKFNPTIFGNRIAWEDWRNGNSDIYIYDLSVGEEKCVTKKGFNVLPSIFDDKLIWRNSINGNGIEPTVTCVYDLNYSKITIIDGFLGSSSAIYGENIILYKYNEKSAPNLYVHNLTNGNEYLISESPYIIDPCIYGDKIVFRMGNGEPVGKTHDDIYLCKLDF